MKDEKKNYTVMTMKTYQGQAKSRITTLYGLRKNVQTRFFAATRKSSKFAKTFNSLISKYTDIINEERIAFNIFVDEFPFKDRVILGEEDTVQAIKEITGGGTKDCPGCVQTLPIDKFYAVRTGKNGLTKYCKECTKRRQRKYKLNRRTG